MLMGTNYKPLANIFFLGMHFWTSKEYSDKWKMNSYLSVDFFWFKKKKELPISGVVYHAI